MNSINPIHDFKKRANFQFDMWRKTVRICHQIGDMRTFIPLFSTVVSPKKDTDMIQEKTDTRPFHGQYVITEEQFAWQAVFPYRVFIM